MFCFTLETTSERSRVFSGERTLLDDEIKVRHSYINTIFSTFFSVVSLALSSLSFYLSVSRRVRGLLQAAAGLADSEERENNLGSALFHHLLLSEVCF